MKYDTLRNTNIYERYCRFIWSLCFKEIKTYPSNRRFLVLLGGGGWSGTQATTGLLYQSLMMVDDDYCGAVGGMSGKGNRSTLRKPAPVPVYHKSHTT
jgi:hypothetical protein